MDGSKFRRVAIDDNAATYVSEGPEIVAEDYEPGDGWLDEQRDAEAKDDFHSEAHRLRQDGWSTARIGLELHATEDEVRAVSPDGDIDGDPVEWGYTPAEIYGVEPDYE